MRPGFESARLILALLIIFGLSGLTPVTQAQVQEPPQYQVLAFNNLGMHCMDADFSVFSLLPPFNTVRAQLVLKGLKPQLLDNTQHKLMFNAVTNPQLSINTTSAGKTNFWQNMAPLFGPQFSNWQPDVGILGIRMPGLANALRNVRDYNPTFKWFEAPGLPITNLDDSLNTNPFPMMRIQAYKTGDGSRRSRFLDSLDIVVPVSSEMNCAECHETGMDAAPPPRLETPPAFVDPAVEPNQEVRVRKNILILHDALTGTNLINSQPVLCAQCHYSAALDLAGKGQPTGDQVGHLYLSRAMHKHHGTTFPSPETPEGFAVPIPEEGVTTCYFCHPGNDTQCLRSVMAVKGMSCQSCHGPMLSVAGFTAKLADPTAVLPADLTVKLKTTKAQRRPWVDMPKCQSCHWGDAVNHFGKKIVTKQVYILTDEAATPILAPNSRFKETSDLYQFSLGHGGVACMACHGSTHAEWPARIDTNDNVTATQLQGHTGEIAECGVCHSQGLAPTLNGPHGLHNIGDRGWMANHSTFYRQDATACQACHGLDLKGTLLSRAKADRTMVSFTGQAIPLTKGIPVSCYACHTTIQ